MADIVLASASQTRIDMLFKAGIEASVIPAKIDEASIKSSLISEEETGRNISDVLAEYKARQISTGRPDLVLGSDQILECDGLIESKVGSVQEAAEKLTRLQGKTHMLHSSAVIYENHQPVWRSTQSVRMTMRALSEEQIERYLDLTGVEVLRSVGCYHYEGVGSQLFTQVIGDYFSILGMPLLDILGFLRTRGIGI